MTDTKATKRTGKPARPDPPAGRPTTCRIARIVRGHGHGFIRAADGREVFFHRADVQGAKFNDLAVGAVVAFEVIEDQFSGPRAAHVHLKISRR